MRKTKIIVTAVAMLLLLLVSQISYAEDSPIQVIIDGKSLDFDVPPQIIEERTYVPMRAIFESLGATVRWDAETSSVFSKKGDTEVVLTLHSILAKLNGIDALLQAPPLQKDGRTLVPVRVIAESFGCNVKWDGALRTVSITTGSTDAIQPFLEIDNTKVWKRIDTGSIRSYYYQNDQFVEKQTKKIMEIYNDTCNQFKHNTLPYFSENALVPVFFLDKDTFEKYTGIKNAAGVWYSGKRAMFINLEIADSEMSDLVFEIVLRHEIIHAITLSSMDTKIRDMPVWFSEGMADFYEMSYDGAYKYKLKEVQDAITRRYLLPLDKLDAAFSDRNQNTIDLAYYESDSFIRFLINNYPEVKIKNIFYTDSSFEDALKEITSKSLTELENDWIFYVSKLNVD